MVPVYVGECGTVHECRPNTGASVSSEIGPHGFLQENLPVRTEGADKRGFFVPPSRGTNFADRFVLHSSDGRLRVGDSDHHRPAAVMSVRRGGGSSGGGGGGGGGGSSGGGGGGGGRLMTPAQRREASATSESIDSVRNLR
jgi:hypothetical protein